MSTETAAPTSDTQFDPARGWIRSSQVGLRPEPFGALAYHFVTRRLVFLKSLSLVELVGALADHDSATEAVEAIISPADESTLQSHLCALESLAKAGVIVPRTVPIENDANPNATSTGASNRVSNGTSAPTGAASGSVGGRQPAVEFVG